MKPRNLTCFLKGLAPLLSACWFVPTLAHCQGSIVYVNPPDHQMISRGEISRFHDIDMNGDGMTDFVFKASSEFIIYSTTGNRSIVLPQGGLDPGNFSIPLAMGFEISSLLPSPLVWHASFEWGGTGSGNWAGQTLHAVNDIGALGYWQPNLTGYLGVEFQISGNLHYGWIRLSTLLFPTANGGTIHDWAYNSTPGQPILAGQVPEPGTIPLLLAAGGFLWWRIRRRPVHV